MASITNKYGKRDVHSDFRIYHINAWFVQYSISKRTAIRYLIIRQIILKHSIIK